MTEHTTPVLIVGGGIVGLSASLSLSHHSIPHILIERHQTTSIHPRARGLNTRAMEVFRALSVDELVREAGASLSPSMGIVAGPSFAEVMAPRPRSNGPRGEMPFAKFVEGVSPTNGCRCTQDRMEPVLLSEARKRGGQLLYNTQLESFTQSPSAVTATVLDCTTNTTFTIHAKYLIAADGASSPIRTHLSIPTTGAGPLGNLLNILFHADLSSLVANREISLCTITRPEVHGLLTAIDNQSTWVFHLSYSPSAGESPSSFPPSRVHSLLLSALGIPDLKIEIKSILPWQPSDICASRFRSEEGRIFLAGDAAHQTTPYAGQGATTGISDVWDLSWKLASVLNGVAGEALLNTYEEERIPVGQFVARESGLLADEYGLPNVASKGKVGLLWNIASRGRMIAGFGYSYTISITVLSPEDKRQGWWEYLSTVPWTTQSLLLGLNGRPGTRVPHLWVQYQGQRVSTLDLCCMGDNLVLLAGSEGRGWTGVAVQVARELGVEIEAHWLGPTGDVGDVGREWDGVAGVGRKGAVLVRPDGFVCWRSRGEELEEARRGVARFKDVVAKVLCL